MKQKPDFQYIAEILDDYCDIHSDGLVGEPLEYSEDSVREQIGLLKGFSADLEQREEDAMRHVREDIYLALQAQVDQMRELLIRVVKSEEYIFDCDLIVAVSSDLASEISETIDATPAQCLAEIKAQAVEDIVNWDHSYVQDGDGEFYFSSSAIEQYVNELRNSIREFNNGSN